MKAALEKAARTSSVTAWALSEAVSGGMVCLIVLSCELAIAQPQAATGKSPAKDQAGALPAPQANAADELALRQDRLSSRYGELEKLLLRMAEQEAAANPRRAAVLKQAASQSAEHLTKSKLGQISKLLNGQQLKRAIDSQTDVQADLKLLLALLQSENENAHRKSEQEKIKAYIQQVKRLERLQGSLKARTEQSEDPKALSKEQSGLAEQTEQLKQDIAEQEGDPSREDEAPSEVQPEDSAKGDKEKKASPEGNEKTPGAKTPPSESPKSEQKGQEPSAGEDAAPPEKGDEKSPPSPGGPPKGEQSPSSPKKESQPGQGGKEMPESSDEAPPEAPAQEKAEEKAEDQTAPPVQKRIEAAQKRMQEAKKKLEQAKREEAVKEQQKAEEELKKAVAELEEILKQMREEEVEQTLADLATRFRKMHELELKVHESTQQLLKIPEDKRGREVDLQSTRLSADQHKILGEAEKALALLGDEGSSTAFPATVEQLCQDMQQIIERLATVKIDAITIGVQEEVIQTLEQLIAALDLEQKEREKKKRQEEQESPAPQQQPGEDPLIDRIAELKMIRSLQQRINQRTQRYSKLLSDPADPIGQANSDDLESAILQLSKREAEVFRVTRDIVVGRKN